MKNNLHFHSTGFVLFKHGIWHPFTMFRNRFLSHFVKKLYLTTVKSLLTFLEKNVSLLLIGGEMRFRLFGICVILKKQMTIFSRYIDSENKLIKKSMEDLSRLITDESNKNEIAEIVYHRLYDRYLKIFFFQPNIHADYKIEEEKKTKDTFHFEYKSGFLMMCSACLLIETIASFLQGNNKTIGQGNDNFQIVFEKCEEYGNSLREFRNQNLYKSVRNGILHQGESYDKYRILRKGPLYDRHNQAVNAKLFIDDLKKFLESYRDELKSDDSKWDSEIWDNCRAKIRYIIKNS